MCPRKRGIARARARSISHKNPNDPRVFLRLCGVYQSAHEYVKRKTNSRLPSRRAGIRFEQSGHRSVQPPANWHGHRLIRRLLRRTPNQHLRTQSKNRTHMYARQSNVGIFIQIVPHDAVLNIDDFKNMPSLAPPIYINPKEGTRYYGAIIGVYGEVGKFRPDYVTVPPLPVAPPPRTPYTRVIVMNAFPRDSDVEVTFKSTSHFRALSYGHSTSGSLHLKRNDPYRIESIPSENENGTRAHEI